MIQTIFTILVALGFVFITLHDLVDIPGWAHGRQVRAAIGPTKTVIGTLVNGIFPGLALFYAIQYWHRVPPTYVLNYWVIYCAITMAGAIQSWWIPYFWGTNEKTKQLYAAMYAGTRQVLPARGDNPRPNLLHLYFHALGLSTLILAVMLRLGIG